MSRRPDDLRAYDFIPGEMLDTMPVGTIRDFALGGVYCQVEKMPGGLWTVHRREGVPSVVLGRCRSADWTPSRPPSATAVAPHVRAMRRVAGASQ